MKRKTSAIFAVIMLTFSVFIVAPLPVQAQADALVTFRDMIFQDPATGAVTPAPGNVPWNTALDYPADKDLMGDLYIVGLMAINYTTVYNLSSWETGFTYDPTVLRVVAVYNVTPSALLPQTIFEIAAVNYSMPVTWEPGTIIKYNGTVTTHKHSIIGGYYMPINQPVVLAYILFIVYGYGDTYIPLTGTAMKDEAGSPLVTPTAPGYFKFRIHQVGFRPHPTVWTTPPYTVGMNVTMPVVIQTTENVNSWELNLTYYGLDEFGVPKTPTIACPSSGWVKQGAFLLVNNRTSPHGGNSFNVQVGAGWIWANGTYNVATQYANAWTGSTLMLIDFSVTGYGTNLLNITDFRAVDDTGASITPGPVADLDEGWRMTVFKFERLVVLSSLFQDTMATTMTWTYPAHTTGETFNMVLVIPPTFPTSQNVHSWKAGFRFNPKVLECLAVTEGTFLSSSGATTWNPNIVINNTKGEVSNITCTGDSGVYSTGSGTLMIITFNVTGTGRSLIQLTDTDGDPTEVKLWDNAANEIRNSFGLSLGLSVFEFRAAVNITMSISSLNKYVTKGEIFNVTLTIDSLENLYSWQSGLHFNDNNEMLECLDVSYGDFFSSVAAPNNQTLIRNDLDYVSVGQTFLGDYYATGSGTLVTITFNVTKTALPIGPSTMDLTDLVGDPCQTVVIDWNGDKCELTPLQDGEVRIFGDVSGEGEINVVDMLQLKVAITKIMLGQITHAQALAANPWLNLWIDAFVDVVDMLQLKVVVTKIMLGTW